MVYFLVFLNLIMNYHRIGPLHLWTIDYNSQWCSNLSLSLLYREVPVFRKFIGKTTFWGFFFTHFRIFLYVTDWHWMITCQIGPFCVTVSLLYNYYNRSPQASNIRFICCWQLTYRSVLTLYSMQKIQWEDHLSACVRSERRLILQNVNKTKFASSTSNNSSELHLGKTWKTWLSSNTHVTSRHVTSTSREHTTIATAMIASALSWSELSWIINQFFCSYGFCGMYTTCFDRQTR